MSAEDVESFWKMLERSYDIEPRSFFEAKAVKQGYAGPLSMALHHTWKRNVRVQDIGEGNDYMKARRQVAALSGLPLMAVTFDGHIERAAKLMADKDAEIMQLKRDVERAVRGSHV